MGFWKARNGMKYGDGKLWNDDDHKLTEKDLTCPECGKNCTFITDAYSPLTCTKCKTEFA